MDTTIRSFLSCLMVQPKEYLFVVKIEEITLSVYKVPRNNYNYFSKLLKAV